ncbi:MAG TPA: hypothetical protein VGG17_00075 [Acidimicrobiales bacterium]
MSGSNPVAADFIHPFRTYVPSVELNVKPDQGNKVRLVADEI